jgi:formate-dependent nitrite reductase membrane component NrfD
MEYRWDYLVVIYLYFGGLSAGLFVFSALLTFLRDDRFDSLRRFAGLAAPIPVSIGSIVLIFDLGNPLRFWRLFSTVQFSSPMSIGSWLLIAFTGVTVLHMLLLLFPDRPDALKFGGLRLPLPGPAKRDTLRRFFAAVGIPMALGVGIYTGVLLGAIPARPFWNTPLVAMLFLFSALSTAAALMMIYANWRPQGGTESLTAQRHLLYGVDVGIILLEILLLIPYILHNALSTASQAASLDLILGGAYTQLFWVGFVGIGLLIPLVLEVGDLLPAILGRTTTRHNRMLGYLSGIMVLVGGFILRWVFVFAGQDSTFG